MQRLWDVRVPLLIQFSLPGLLLAGLGWIHLWLPKRRASAGTYRWLIALLLSVYLVCLVLITVTRSLNLGLPGVRKNAWYVVGTSLSPCFLLLMKSRIISMES